MVIQVRFKSLNNKSPYLNRKVKPCGNQSTPQAVRSNHSMTQCSFLFPVLPVNFHFWEMGRYNTMFTYGV